MTIEKLRRKLISLLAGEYYAVYIEENHDDLENCPACGKLIKVGLP